MINQRVARGMRPPARAMRPPAAVVRRRAKSKMYRLVILTLISVVLLLVTNAVYKSLYPEKGTTWALLISGGVGFEDYSNQANICTAYQALIEGGIDKNNIVVFMYDTNEFSPYNWKPGFIESKFSKYKNICEGVHIDYKGSEVTVENVLLAFLGNPTTKKPIISKAQDKIFVYFDGHGANGYLVLAKQAWMSSVFQNMLYMKSRDSYESILIYIDACNSGSMLNGFHSNGRKILAVTSAKEDEPAFQIYCKRFAKDRSFCLTAAFSEAWFYDRFKNGSCKSTVAEQVEYLGKAVSSPKLSHGSTITVTGDMSLLSRKISLYQGCLPYGSTFYSYDLEGIAKTLVAVEMKEAAIQKGHFVRRVQAQRSVSERILKGAIADTEDAWIDLVRGAREQRPDVTRVGSCCLVGLIWNGMLYVGNLGDSRAVIGRLTGDGNKVIADEITEDHNANLDEVREELKKQNKDDPDIVVKVNGVWRVKGLIQISRSIGDLHLKMQEFVDANQPMRMIRPALSDEPFLTTRILGRETRFVVFASDGLWENMTSQEAVDIVNRHPRAGIAKTLVAVAMKEAAIQKGLKYDNLPDRYQQPGNRRVIHDDITVAVLFLDNGIPRADLEREVSVKGMVNESTPSELRMLGGDIFRSMKCQHSF